MAVEETQKCELCTDHLGSSFCEECGLDVDEYGNTENSFKHCSFPDCGCDGARLCMAEEGASEHACRGNLEGMWSSNAPEAKKAILDLVGFVGKK